MRKTINSRLRPMFQFHLVRLKVWFGCFWFFSSYTFQFHLVRLKAPKTLFEVADKIKFQFHLVRLKVDFLLLHALQWPQFQFHLVRLKDEQAGINNDNLAGVSIPFSTIKSGTGRPERIPTDAVSIPFSTIKRPLPLIVPLPFISFQFHLVRLKGGLGLQLTLNSISFNSI